jgi:hypothetical protein
MILKLKAWIVDIKTSIQKYTDHILSFNRIRLHPPALGFQKLSFSLVNRYLKNHNFSFIVYLS